ncbi:MAG: hypothetical protein C0485_18690 [Pirellula sp.]|nr:hypothetical protein [Pirellula sp.]
MFMTAKMFTAVALMVCLAVQAQAQQTNYSQTQTNAIKNRNSAAAYSSQSIKSQVFNRSVPQFGFSSVNRGLFKGAMSGQTKSKPFSHAQQGPSASPYMGLLSDNPFTSTTTNYFNNVRPQLEQQKMNEKLMQQNIKMQKQLEEVSARPPYDITGSEQRAPTGHAAVYQNNGGVYGNPGGYYPQVPIRSVRGQK